jgi:hypothetical protein
VSPFKAFTYKFSFVLFVKKILIKLLCRRVFIPELFMTNVRMPKLDYRGSMTSRSSDFEKINKQKSRIFQRIIIFTNCRYEVKE